MTETTAGHSSNFLSVERPTRPYPGLRPFDENEWMIFFGREEMIEDVIERLSRQTLVFIHGASGSGKSSLVKAGVLPKLEGQHRSHGEEWHTFTLRPSGGPLWNLAQKFAEFEGRSHENARDERVDEIARLFDRRDATLASVAGEIEGLAGKRLCILVDQFEELFRFEREISREVVEVFINLLIGKIDTTSDHAKIHAVVTMRSEFLGDCARFEGLAEAINRTQYLVPRMSHEALLRAIQRPAQIYGGEVTIELAERLIAEVRGREDELPLIQHGLMELWKKAFTTSKERNEKITLDVGLLGKGGSLESLLSNHADEVMETVAGPWRLQKGVENLFRALIEQTAKKQGIRRPQQFKELVAVSNVDAQKLKTIIEAFRADGVSFLTPPSTEIKDDTTIDISHEALIRWWKKIADEKDGWLKRETEDGIRWSLLLAQAREFATDPKRILPGPVERAKFLTAWLAERPERWCNRYGGERELVDKWLKASLREAKKLHLVNTFVTMTCIWITILNIPIVLESSGIDKGSAILNFFYVVLGIAILIWIPVALIVYIRRVYDFVNKLVRRNLIQA